MNRKIILFFTALGAAAAFFLFSCGQPDVLLLTDHYLYEAGYFTKDRMRDIEGAVRKQGKTVELAVIEYSGSAPERVVRAVSESGAQTVVTTPILGETAEAAMQELPPEVRLVRLEYGSGRGGARGESSGSTGIVGLSRIEAFSDLGSQLGEILDDKKYSEGGVGAVGMWYTGTKARKEEYEAFIASFSAVCSPERLEIEGVNTVPDSSAVRRYLEEIRKKGVFFGIAFISHQNPELITSYRGLGFGIVSEYLFPEKEFPVSTQVLSIEYPFAEAVAAAAELAEGDEDRATVDAVIKKNIPPDKNN